MLLAFDIEHEARADAAMLLAPLEFLTEEDEEAMEPAPATSAGSSGMNPSNTHVSTESPQNPCHVSNGSLQCRKDWNRSRQNLNWVTALPGGLDSFPTTYQKEHP